MRGNEVTGSAAFENPGVARSKDFLRPICAAVYFTVYHILEIGGLAVWHGNVISN
jgi:hypothetical protein